MGLRPLPRLPRHDAHLGLRCPGCRQGSEARARRPDDGVGLILLVVGIAITVVTHDNAEENGGGTYVIAYGPMIIGGIRFFQGLFGMMA